MKHFAALISAILCLLLCSSCATSSRLSVANSATISQANFRIVRPISREYTAQYFFGIGGFKKATKLQAAIDDMTKELGPNQALAYINVVESNFIPLIPIIMSQTTHVSAEIIEYTE